MGGTCKDWLDFSTGNMIIISEDSFSAVKQSIVLLPKLFGSKEGTTGRDKCIRAKGGKLLFSFLPFVGYGVTVYANHNR